MLDVRARQFHLYKLSGFIPWFFPSVLKTQPLSVTILTNWKKLNFEKHLSWLCTKIQKYKYTSSVVKLLDWINCEIIYSTSAGSWRKEKYRRKDKIALFWKRSFKQHLVLTEKTSSRQHDKFNLFICIHLFKHACHIFIGSSCNHLSSTWARVSIVNTAEPSTEDQVCKQRFFGEFPEVALTLYATERASGC